MTQDEALKLARDALEALENISTALREDDVLGSDIELMLDAITTIRETLAQPDEDAIIIRYHEMTIKRLEKRIEELTAQPEKEPVQDENAIRADEREACAKVCEQVAVDYYTRIGREHEPYMRATAEDCARHIRAREQSDERNFCPRCGKRTADPTTIHTCTPPQGNT